MHGGCEGESWQASIKRLSHTVDLAAACEALIFLIACSTFNCVPPCWKYGTQYSLPHCLTHFLQFKLTSYLPFVHTSPTRVSTTGRICCTETKITCVSICATGDLTVLISKNILTALPSSDAERGYIEMFPSLPSAHFRSSLSYLSLFLSTLFSFRCALSLFCDQGSYLCQLTYDCWCLSVQLSTSRLVYALYKLNTSQSL